MVKLEKITGKNVWDILKLCVFERQKNFVASNDITAGCPMNLRTKLQSVIPFIWICGNGRNGRRGTDCNFKVVKTNDEPFFF